MGDFPFLPTALGCTPSRCLDVNRERASRLSVLLIWFLYLCAHVVPLTFVSFIYLPLTVHVMVAPAT